MPRWQRPAGHSSRWSRFPLPLRHIGSVAVSILALTLGPVQVHAQTAGGVQSVQPRIIGGRPTPEDSFPSVLSILLNIPGRSQYERHFCGATLIAPNWALSAAHCFVDEDGNAGLPASEFSVLADENRLSTNRRDDRSNEVGVVSIIPHPDFTLDTFTNDVALLELSEPIDEPVMSLFNGDAARLPGAPALIVGWGVVDDSNPERPVYPRRQQYARVPIVSNEVCNAPDSYNGDVDSTQICAGFPRGGVDSCQGDSGGPLILGIRGQQVQVGIVSYGNGCAMPAFYGVYTNLSLYGPWISNYVDANYLPGRHGGSKPGHHRPNKRYH